MSTHKGLRRPSVRVGERVRLDSRLRPFGVAPRNIRVGACTRQEASLGGPDLKAEIFGVDPALGEAAGDEPEPGLPGAREHAAQFLLLAEAPDRTDAGSDVIPE